MSSKAIIQLVQAPSSLKLVYKQPWVANRKSEEFQDNKLALLGQGLDWKDMLSLYPVPALVMVGDKPTSQSVVPLTLSDDGKELVFANEDPDFLGMVFISEEQEKAAYELDFEIEGSLLEIYYNQVKEEVLA